MPRLIVMLAEMATGTGGGAIAFEIPEEDAIALHAAIIETEDTKDSRAARAGLAFVLDGAPVVPVIPPRRA